jgi:glucose-6-phosphate 1-epimerase
MGGSMSDEIERVNSEFAIMDHIQFDSGPGGLVIANVNNQHAAATIALQGGHVITFQPHGQEPVLFVSQRSRYEGGKAIRGGIPICWPWFGPHPTDDSQPAHGFVRFLPWTVLETHGPRDGISQLRLGLTDSPTTRRYWPHGFRLELIVTVGSALHVDLQIHNTDHDSWSCTGALHSYFPVGDVTHIAIEGLDGTDYIDKVDGGARKTQHGAIMIRGETDRVFLDTTTICTITDPGLSRRIVVEKRGSRSTVVWNPWIDKARLMADFGDDEYRRMVCVETANAIEDVIQVAPGATHTLGTTIDLEAL